MYLLNIILSNNKANLLLIIAIGFLCQCTEDSLENIHSGKLIEIKGVSNTAIDYDENNLITKFEEKPLLQYWINAGFFVFSKAIFNYLPEDEILEKRPFEHLVTDQEVCAYKHSGFWACLDTYKDNVVLSEAWKSDEAGWKVWG